MPDLPPSRVGTPLDRLAVSVKAWNELSPATRQRPPHRGRIDRERITLERAKGAVMLRYGVNSHVAFAMIARWSRTAGVSMTTLATALVEGTVDSSDLVDDQPSLASWLEEHPIDDD